MTIFKDFPVCNNKECNDDCLKFDCKYARGTHPSWACRCPDNENDSESRCSCCKICKYIVTFVYSDFTYPMNYWLKRFGIRSMEWEDECHFCHEPVCYAYTKDKLWLVDRSIKELHLTIKHNASALTEEEEIECLLGVQQLFSSK
jgi:hypothetical protein